MLSSNTYWRDKLSPEYAVAYDIFMRNISRGSAQASFCVRDDSGISELINAILADAPQYFWLDPSHIKTTQSVQGTTLSFSEIYNNREIAAAQRSCDAAAAAVRGASQVETERKIAEHIVRTVTYHINDRYNQNMASALHYKKAQCSGIARAVKYLCDKNGIWCIEVDGTLSTDGGKTSGAHAWNVVCVDGKYYHLDVTTMLGSNPNPVGELYYACFNWSDGEMCKTHSWDRAEVPVCKDVFQDGAKNFAQKANNVPRQGNSKPRFGRYVPFFGGGTPRPNTAKTAAPVRGNYPVYSSMAEFRSQLEKAVGQHKNAMEFNLGVGGTPEAQAKLIQSSVNMTAPKIQDCGGCEIKYDGTKFTLTLKYRR